MSLINVSRDIIFSQSNVFICSRLPNSGSPTLIIFTVYTGKEEKEIYIHLYTFIYVIYIHSLIQIN